MDVKDYFGILGHEATDKVTKFKGVVTSLSFDLYGCVMAWVTPKHDPVKKPEGQWFDYKRLEIASRPPVLQNPFLETRRAREPGPERKAPPPQ